MHSSLKEIKAVLILEDSGKRILTRYYHDQNNEQATSVKKQKEFEKILCKKAHLKLRENYPSLQNGSLIVAQRHADVFFFVLGSLTCNELILDETLDIILDCLSPAILKVDDINTRSLMLNYPSLVLILDEIISQAGIILETDPMLIVERVLEGTKIPALVVLPEKALSKALKGALKIANW